MIPGWLQALIWFGGMGAGIWLVLRYAPDGPRIGGKR